MVHSSPEVHQMRRKLEEEYKIYFDHPERHPMYRFHRENFAKANGYKFQGNPNQMELEWQSAWKRTMHEKFNEDLQRQKKQNGPAMQSSVSNIIKDLVASKGLNIYEEQVRAAEDLDARTLAELSKGLSSMEVAKFIKQLVGGKNVANADAVSKELFLKVMQIQTEIATQEGF